MSKNDTDLIEPVRIEHAVDEIWDGARMSECYNYLEYHFEREGVYCRARAYADDFQAVTMFGPFDKREASKGVAIPASSMTSSSTSSSASAGFPAFNSSSAQGSAVFASAPLMLPAVAWTAEIPLLLTSNPAELWKRMLTDDFLATSARVVRLVAQSVPPARQDEFMACLVRANVPLPFVPGLGACPGNG